MKTAVVLTTINLDAPAIPVLIEECEKMNWELIVVGDRNTKGTKKAGYTYLDEKAQEGLGYKLTKLLPWDNYGRKNLGYLYAWNSGVDCVISTDDDNIPMSNWKDIPSYLSIKETTAAVAEEPFFNFIPCFKSNTNAWPRGIPFDYVGSIPSLKQITSPKIGVVAGLWNKSPDFDAIGHAIFDREDWTFDENKTLYNDLNSLSPYNTQNTLFIRELLPFQYLANSIGRANDIWASYISQLVMKQLGYGVLYTSPTVVQERNAHRFGKDFRDETLCYLSTSNLVESLKKISYRKGIMDYYTSLCLEASYYIPHDNRNFYLEVITWLKDLKVY